MRTIRLNIAIFVMVAGLAAGWTPALGASIMPQRYEMMNGGISTFSYLDDSYNGSGDKTVPYAYLSGGLGDLTDGVIATQNWNNTPGLYVGWGYGNIPVIRFHFSTPVTINTINIFVDDADGSGSVRLPDSYRIQMGSYDNTIDVSELSGSEPKQLQLTGLNISGTELVLTLNPSDIWVMASEITFEGEVVPLPGAVPIGALELLLLDYWRQ
jgi:hypothetical protein